MENLAFNRLETFARELRPLGNARVLQDCETFQTIYANDEPALTLSRPRRYGATRLFTISAIDGGRVATFATSPTWAQVKTAVRAFVRAGTGLAGMTAGELKAEERDALNRERENLKLACETDFIAFEANAINRAIRAARRAEMARELIDSIPVADVRAVAMRATLPGLNAAMRFLSRRLSHAATGEERRALAARLAVLREVKRIKSAPVCPELAAAFALNVRPAAHNAHP